MQEPGSLISRNLVLKLLKANLSRDTKLLGKMDPYVVVSAGANQIQSFVDKSGSKHPEWNQVLVLPLDPAIDIVNFWLWDDRKGSEDKEIAAAAVPLNSLVTGQTVKIPLAFEGKPAGELFMDILAIGGPDITGQYMAMYQGQTQHLGSAISGETRTTTTGVIGTGVTTGVATGVSTGYSAGISTKTQPEVTTFTEVRQPACVMPEQKQYSSQTQGVGMVYETTTRPVAELKETVTYETVTRPVSQNVESLPVRAGEKVVTSTNVVYQENPECPTGMISEKVTTTQAGLSGNVSSSSATTTGTTINKSVI